MREKAMKALADPVIEAVFANEQVAGLAMQSLINAVLNHTGDKPIGEVVRLTPQKTVPNVLSKGYRFDLDARSADESIVDTEIQVRKMDMNNRAFLTGGKLIGESAEKGQAMASVLSLMPRVIIINVCLFELRDTHKGFHQPVELAYRFPKESSGEYERASDRLEIHNLELPKFEKYVLPSLIGKPYSDDEPKLHYWLWAMLKAHREELTVKEVVEMEAALKDFAAVDRGFAQYTERNEDISRDDKIKLQYAIWTEGMSAIEYAQSEVFEAFRDLGVPPEILAQVSAKFKVAHTNLG